MRLEIKSNQQKNVDSTSIRVDGRIKASNI
jgi:hypothetical protein